jgi:hypothetical protein
VDRARGGPAALDWIAALSVLKASELVRDDITATLSTIAKTPDDRDTVTAALDDLGFAPTAQS